MNNLCRLCSIKEGEKNLSNNDVFLKMVTELYSIEIVDYSVKVCSDCRDKTLSFDSHKKAVATKQDIYADVGEMDLLAGLERKRLCRFCATMVGEINVTKLLKLNTFIKDVYDISIDLAGDDCLKYLCRECYDRATEFFVIRMSIIGGNDLYKQIGHTVRNVNTDEWQLGDYSTAPPAPRRSGSSNSTIIGENNEIDGYRTPTPSNLGTSSSNQE